MVPTGPTTATAFPGVLATGHGSPSVHPAGRAPRWRRGARWPDARRGRVRTHRSGRPMGAEFRALTDLSAKQSPVDTIVVVMMENRSFDHYLGWLADDERVPRARAQPVREELQGRREGAADVHRARRHGREDRARCSATPSSRTPSAGATTTTPGTDGGRVAPSVTAASSPRESGNDNFALGYYLADDLPFTSQLARGSRCSTASSRRCSARRTRTATTSTPRSRAARRRTSFPIATGGLPRGRRSGSGSTRQACRRRLLLLDLPFLALWRPTAGAVQHRSSSTSPTAAAGTLPNVAFVDPASSARDPHRRPSARRHPRRAGVRARRVRGLHRVAALGERRLRAHLRRVGRLLRPRRTAGARRRPAQHGRRRRTSARPGSGCRR